MELEVMGPMLGAVPAREPVLQGRITQVPRDGSSRAAAAAKRLAGWTRSWPRPYVAGDRSRSPTSRCSAPSISAAMVGENYDPSLKNLAAWHERMKARPSASA